MTYLEAMAAQDDQRTKRNFISLLGGLAGVDHSMANEDGYAQNRPGGYQTMAPFGVGGVGVEGQPSSTLQNGGFVITLPMLLLAGVAFLMLKKG